MRKYKIVNRILIVIIITLLAYFAINYLLNFFLPQKIKAAVEKFAESAIASKIEIGQIKINILRGVILKDAAVYQKGENNPCVVIKQARLIPFYPAILTHKTIVMSLRINGASLSLERNKEGKFVLPQINEARQRTTLQQAENKETSEPITGKKAAGSKKPLFFIKDITINNLALFFTDSSWDFSKEFKDIYAYVGLGKVPQIQFNANWQDKISINGTYSAETNYLKASCLTKDLALADFNPYFKGFNFKNGAMKSAKIEVEGKDYYCLKGNAKLKDVVLIYPLNNLDTKYKDAAELNGDFNLDAEIKIDKENSSYKLGGSCITGQLKNIPFIDKLNAVQANFNFENNKLELSYLAADLPTANLESNKNKDPEAIHLQAKAELNILDSEFYCEITSACELSRFINAIKNSAKNFTFDYAEKGNIFLKAITKGNFKESRFDYYVEYQIRDAQFKDALGINVSGFIKKDKLSLENGFFNYKNMPVKFKGQIESFSLPEISLLLESKDIGLDLKTKYIKDILNVEELSLKVANSKLTAQGDIDTRIEPKGKLQGLVYLDLKDTQNILRIFNLKYPLLEKISPEGIFKAKFILEGGKDISDWKIKLAGLSEKMKLYNISAQEASIELYRDKNGIIISPFIATVGDGKLDLRTKIDYLNNKITLNIIADKIELSEIKKEVNLKDTNLSGMLSLDIRVENDSLAQWNKMDGEGKLKIKEGNIWEINFLKGLGQFLFIPEFDSIVFEEGYSDLVFKGENVVFDNAQLKSPQMTLRGRGRISVAGDIDFILVSEFNPNLISASESLKKSITNILSKNTLAIELSGTLKKPNYKLKPVIFSNFQNIKDLLEGILK